jgi:transposase-like protein
MQQTPMSLIEFQQKFATEEACQQHLFSIRWPNGYRCPRCGHDQASFHSTRHLYQCKACKYQASLTAGTIFHKTRTPLKKWFWMIFLMGRQKSGVSMLSLQRMLEIGSYKTVWAMGHKIRKAMAERDAQYKLAGLIEVDDSYFGSSKPGKRGRGASGKGKVVFAVEVKNDKPGFATIKQVENLGADQISQGLKDRLEEDAEIRTDGWRSYGSLNTGKIKHSPVVVGSGKNAIKVLPWVHTLIANVKGTIRGVYRGVSTRHLSRYLGEFCYRFNRRFWESQIFDRLLTACLNSSTITFAELRA